MKIFIIGGGGRVGQALAKQLANEGHTVVVGVHEHRPTFSNDHIQTVPFDSHAQPAEQASLIGQVDAIYFVAGSRSKDLLQTDAFGVVTASEAAKLNGIQRFILLSSLFATQPQRWDQGFLKSIRDYNIAKFFADHWLIDHSGLDYTILQPGILNADQPATGKIAVNVPELGENPLADVVTTLAGLLKADNTVHKVITMHAGDEPIQQAIERL